MRKIVGPIAGTIRRYAMSLWHSKWNLLRQVLPIRPRNTFLFDCGEPARTVSCLVATKKGLYGLTEGRLTKLINGSFYGLTTDGDRWFAFQCEPNSWGRILTFSLEGHRVVRLKQIIGKLDWACHQIDFVGKSLYVTDTHSNRLLIYTLRDGKVLDRSLVYPAGELDKGRSSDNYAHVNSIWRDASGLYLGFHNETTKTDRNSEIVRLDTEHRIVERYLDA